LSVVLRDLRKSFEPQRTRAPVAACSARFVGVERQVMTECPAGGQSLTGEQARWQSLAVFESVVERVAFKLPGAWLPLRSLW